MEKPASALMCFSEALLSLIRMGSPFLLSLELRVWLHRHEVLDPERRLRGGFDWGALKVAIVGASVGFSIPSARARSRIMQSPSKIPEGRFRGYARGGRDQRCFFRVAAVVNLVAGFSQPIPPA